MDPTQDPRMEMPIHGRHPHRREDVLQDSRARNRVVPASTEVNPDAIDWSVGAAKPSAEQIAYWESIKNVVSPITTGLNLSGFPMEPVQVQIKDLGIDVVFSCTNREPPELGVPIVRIPFDDSVSELPSPEMLAANAEDIAARVTRGENVLIHCLYGLNRSALLAAYAIAILYPGIPGEEILRTLRQGRPGALHNELFAAAVAGLNQPVQ